MKEGGSVLRGRRGWANWVACHAFGDAARPFLAGWLAGELLTGSAVDPSPTDIMPLQITHCGRMIQL